jgi:hypothetical protein
MNPWKIAAIGFGIATVILWRKLHRAPAGVAMSGRPAPLSVVRGTRGDDLGIKQALLGAKKVAEGAKESLLGPEKSDAREADKAQRKG